jgi:hypothetical protein
MNAGSKISPRKRKNQHYDTRITIWCPDFQVISRFVLVSETTVSDWDYITCRWEGELQMQTFTRQFDSDPRL